MIFLGKHRRITVLGIVIGRIKIKECVWPVILLDNLPIVLVFNDDICQSAGAFPNQIEETANIAGFSGKGLGAAAEAVSNQLEKSAARRTSPRGARSSIILRMVSASGGSRYRWVSSSSSFR